MHIALTENKTFDADILGQKFTGLTIESQWERLAKLIFPSGEHLIILLEEGQIVDGSTELMDMLLGPVVTPGYLSIRGRTILVGEYEIEVPAFQVAKFMNCVDSSGKAYVSETEKPRVRINFKDSIKACDNAGEGLILGSQHLAIAMDIASVDENWSGGKVGSGILRRGLHRGTVSGAQDGTYVSPHADENRWFILPNGDQICDFAGHLLNWMVNDLPGNVNGLAGKIPADSPYLKVCADLTQSQGAGYRPDGARDWSGYALLRGGCWGSGSDAGVFVLDLASPGFGFDYVGFRSTMPN